LLVGLPPLVPSDFKDALVRCITENRLKSLTIRRFSLPQGFIKIFPLTLEALDIEGYVSIDDSGFTAKYVKAGSSNPVNTARPTHIAVNGLTGGRAWISSQTDHLFTRLSSLDIRVSQIPSLAAFLSSMAAYTLTNLSLRHQGRSYSKLFHLPRINKFETLTKISMKVFQTDLEGLQSATLPFMPSLEELSITVIDETREAAPCPAEAVAIAGAYIVPAFRPIRTFRLTIEWKSSREAQQSLGGRIFQQGTRDAFARLDESLKDKRLLESLREVEINFGLVYLPAGDLEDGEAKDIQKVVRSEVLQVLHGTVERVNTFSVKTSPLRSNSSIPSFLPRSVIYV
jgi:hypothetical protein